jgi:hypothetical protein
MSRYPYLTKPASTAVTDALVAMGHIVLTNEGGEVTPSGGRFLSAFGADLRPGTLLRYRGSRSFSARDTAMSSLLADPNSRWQVTIER